MITKGILGKMLKNNRYGDMVTCYKRHGLGIPSRQMIKFYERSIEINMEKIVENNANSWTYTRVTEYTCLIKLIEAILNHNEHLNETGLADIYQQLSEVY